MTLRADIEATVKEWRKDAESAENRKIFKSEGTTAAHALRYCADTLERLISQHTGEGQDPGDELDANDVDWIRHIADDADEIGTDDYNQALWPETRDNLKRIAVLIEAALSSASSLEHTGEGVVTDEMVEAGAIEYRAFLGDSEPPTDNLRRWVRLILEAALSAAPRSVGQVTDELALIYNAAYDSGGHDADCAGDKQTDCLCWEKAGLRAVLAAISAASPVQGEKK